MPGRLQIVHRPNCKFKLFANTNRDIGTGLGNVLGPMYSSKIRELKKTYFPPLSDHKERLYIRQKIRVQRTGKVRFIAVVFNKHATHE